MNRASVKLPAIEQIERAAAHHTRQSRLLRSLLRILRQHRRVEVADERLATMRHGVDHGPRR